MLRHYGVTDFERTPDLEEAVFRVFLAQQRSAPEVQLATSILQRWLVEPVPAPPHDAAARDAARPPRRRDPAALPRHRRPRPQRPLPLVRPAARRRGARRACSPGCATSSRRSPPSPTAPDHAARIDALAAIPEQIVRFLAERLHEEAPERLPEHEPMLEVLIKRHYREHELHGLRTFSEGGRPFAVADYTLDDRPTHLTSTIGGVDELVAGQPARRGRVQRRRGRGPTGHAVRRRPLPALARGAGVARRRERAAGRAARSSCPSPRTCAGSPSP